MVDVNEVAENIYLIDNQLYSIPRWGSTYLINEDKKALVDTGPTTSANVVLDGIKKIGIRPEDIDYIIATHIHLDHAGGAGFLARFMPRAKVLVHHRGARHLVNPVKLVSSVVAFQGEEAMAREGEVVPVEEHRVQPIYDGDEVELSDKQLLRFIDAPGHAQHELCIYESRNGGLFTGDAVGVSVADNTILLPSTPAPNFDGELYISTIQRLMKLDAARLYFGHFGATGKVQENLRLAIDKLQVWHDMVTRAIKANDFDGLAEKMIAEQSAELEPIKGKMGLLYKYLSEGNIPVTAAGYIRYYREKYKAGIS